MLRLAVAQTRNADHYLNAPDSSSAVMHKPGAEPPGNTGFRSISRGPWTFPLISLALNFVEERAVLFLVQTSSLLVLIDQFNLVFHFICFL
jgi:hypothetical protein